MLLNLGYWHPQVVHFVIALGFVGVVLRLVSLTGRFSFTGPAAATLLLLSTGAAVAAVQSGKSAEGPVERIPGIRAAFVEHEEAGEWARNVLLAVAALEVAALAMRTRPARRWVLMGSGAVGLVGMATIYRAASLGGELVYKYAAGVGTRYDDSTDVKRLLLAGFYQDAMADRAVKRAEAAATTIDEMAKRFPDNPAVQLMRAESMLLDRKDGRAALTALGQIAVPPDDMQLRSRHGTLKADAYVAAGLPDSARVTLEALVQEFPNNQRIKQKLAQLP